MQLMATEPLKQIRKRLGLTQEGLARRTRSVTLGTIKNAEKGRPVKVDTATQILEVLNAVLAEQGKPGIGLADLELKLY
jgi:transcriptional regulator with XRE-family HTH domain